MSDIKIKSTIEKLVADYWQENQKPLLLSGLVPMLASNGVMISDVLSGMRVKEYLKQTSEDGANYKLIVDSVHKARIGLIPSEEKYTYSTTHIAATREELKRGSREVTLEFLSLIEQLPAEEASQVSIPVRILAKLLNS